MPVLKGSLIWKVWAFKDAGSSKLTDVISRAELCFWLFLVNSGTSQQNWFHSLYFKSWVLGSIVAVIYMPLVTVLTRSDPLRSEAFTFLAGSLGSISLTLWFTPILFTFPSFLQSLGLAAQYPRYLLLWYVLKDSAPQDSSTYKCAFKVFFPRSIEGEIASRDDRKRSKSGQTNEASLYESPHELTTNVTQLSTQTLNYGTPAPSSRPLLLTSPLRKNAKREMDGVSDNYPSSTIRTNRESRRTPSMDRHLVDEQNTNLPPLRPNRKKGDDIELARVDEAKEQPGIYTSNVNHLVHNFTSSIGMFHHLCPRLHS
ncbi:hypothetical protein C0992_003577 [Termitomyces sp. T32_za158]|nr:hypothetical protein C0992_003577 [Termitomyces sp. T32_za158]